MTERRYKFRFEDLEIWKFSVEISIKLFELADDLEAKKRYRFAEQIRGSALSTPNNIAEGSGSTSKKEFIQFLNIARRSIFENANMLIIFNKINLIEDGFMNELLKDLDTLGRMITAFSRRLKE